MPDEHAMAEYTHQEVESLRKLVVREILGELRQKNGNSNLSEDSVSPSFVEDRVRTYLMAGVKAEHMPVANGT